MLFRIPVFFALCSSALPLGCGSTVVSDSQQSGGAAGSGGATGATGATGSGATGGGGAAGTGGSGGGTGGTGGATCVEGPLGELNAEQPLSGSTSDSSLIYAFTVTFAEAREIHRIEFLTGGAPNASDYTFWVEIHADDLGKPGEAVVAPGASTLLGTTVDWHGVDLSWSAQAATPYWIVFDLGGPNGPIQLPWSESGDTFVTYWGVGGYGDWSPQSPTDVEWRARFIGCE